MGPCWIVMTPLVATMGDVGDLVVINAMDIHHLIRFLNDTNVVASNAIICTPINK